MKGLFLDLETSIIFKELGFKEPCFAYYYTNDLQNVEEGKYDVRCKFYFTEGLNEEEYNVNSDKTYYVSAPLYSQIFDWVREKHNINAWVSCFQEDDDLKIDGTYSYFIYKDKQYMADQVDFETNKEAQMECIKTLIKLLKNE